MKSLAHRFTVYLIIVAVAPLVVYGLLSVRSLRQGTVQSVEAGNLNLARRAADQIAFYVAANIKVLHAVAAELEGTRLEPWQQERTLRNYVLRFREYRELTLFGPDGRPVATSRLGGPHLHPPPPGIEVRDLWTAPLAIDDDLLPTTKVGIAVATGAGRQWLMGEFDVLEMWRLVDRLRIGDRGFALVVAEDGRLIAHGDPNAKRHIVRAERLSAVPGIGPALAGVERASGRLEYPSASGETMLAFAVPIAGTGWTVVVEQPTSEAFAIANRLGRLLGVAILLAVSVTVVAGFFWGRSIIRPIRALIRGTDAIAAGRLDERVAIDSHDEFGQLGQAFNSMADRLVALQDEIRRQERQATFGRIAVGLVHDLSHPVKNIGNSCRLILKMHEDAEYRETFRRTVEREFATLRRMLDDLRNLARPMPLESFPVDVNRSVADAADAMRRSADIAGLTLEVRLADRPVRIHGDLFALGRVYRNLMLNAIQATGPGGTVSVQTELDRGQARITVSDTGCGIPPDRLGAIFEDYVTTKRRGLGLGLAISRKIVEQLGGRIGVSSEVGVGTRFVLEFDAIEAGSEPGSTAGAATASQAGPGAGTPTDPGGSAADAG